MWPVVIKNNILRTMTQYYYKLFRLEFPSVLILYQDVIMSIHGVMVLIGFMDRRLFCSSSDDLLESYDSPSAFCTASGE